MHVLKSAIDREALNLFLNSPEAAALRARHEADVLTRRVGLVERRARLRRDLAKAGQVGAARVAAAGEAVVKAADALQTARNAARDAERQYLESTVHVEQEIRQIEAELVASVPSALEEALTATRAAWDRAISESPSAPDAVGRDMRGQRVFDHSNLVAHQARVERLRTAILELTALHLEALDANELDKKLASIRRLIDDRVEG